MFRKSYPSYVRCYLRPADGEYLAVCLELFLVAKGRTPEEARNKLEGQMQSYLECLDKKNYDDLFPRYAPLRYHIDYYWVGFLILIGKTVHVIHKKYAHFLERLQPSNWHLNPA